MKYVFLILTLVLIFLSGCEPLSFPETSNETDVVGDVLALVTPDTAQENTQVPVKLSFPNICGGTFKKLIVTYDSSGNVNLQPIIHQVPQQVCPAVYSVQTVSASVKFSRHGTYQIAVIGNYGSFRKTIRVISDTTLTENYRLRFQFLNRSKAERSFQTTSLRLFSQTPDTMFSITANESGIWDSTFTLPAGTLQYHIGGFEFSATRGVTEHGIIIIP
ncbi:MAG: hypothetical protein HY960_05690 [Ignavibacteriae bacterium]|nr:hypothetical protein [Ignavibacteriota bacterium]